MISSRPVLFCLGALFLLAGPAHAQSKGALKRAEKALVLTDVERRRASFEELSTELRALPEAATGHGWWLRGDLAVHLARGDSNPVTFASVALDSYHEALNLGVDTPSLDALDGLEKVLLPLASATGDQPPAAAFAAAEQLLISLDIRRRVQEAGGPALDPISETRIQSVAVRAALADGRVRIARKLFLDLDAKGGFMEPLALDIATQLEERAGAHQVFLFLTALLENHGNRRNLLVRYVELCSENGWFAEAQEGLGLAVPRMSDSYEDQLFLARNYELLRHPERALERYEAALDKAPKGFEANLGKASLLFAMAIELQPAVDPEAEEPPEIDEVAQAQAILYQRKAVRALETGLEANPGNPSALALLVELHRVLEDEDAMNAAQARLEASAKSAPGQPR